MIRMAGVEGPESASWYAPRVITRRLIRILIRWIFYSQSRPMCVYMCVCVCVCVCVYRPAISSISPSHFQRNTAPRNADGDEDRRDPRRTLHFSEIRGEKEERPREGRARIVDSLPRPRVDLGFA